MMIPAANSCRSVRTAPTWRAPVLAILLALGWTASARAGRVQLLAEGDEAYVGVPLTVAIDITAKQGHDAPQFPALADAEVVAAGQPSITQRQMIINGVRSQETSTRYLFRVTPQAEGRLVIPPIAVPVDGETLQTRARVIRVTRSETGDLLWVELDAARERIYVGESIDVMLRVGILPFTDRRANFNENQMWRQIDRNLSSWGIFEAEVKQRRPQVSVRRNRQAGPSGTVLQYFLYEIKHTLTAERTGELDVGNVNIVVDYPVKVRTRRGFFGGLEVSQTRPVAVTPDSAPVTVLPIPTANRPVGFTGAVGPARIRTTASPDHVQVGDPITLNIIVEGKGPLDAVQAPPLAQLPEFTRDFQISEDPLAGVIDGKTKRFTQSIRALRDDVTEIPAIPFAYFDTRREQFVSVAAPAIVIAVAPAERMSMTQIVDSGAVMRGPSGPLTQTEWGIEGNYTNLDDLLAVPSPPPVEKTTAVLVASPLLYFACVAARWRRRRGQIDPVGRRRRSARKRALRRLGQVGTEDNAAACAAVLLDYLADRFNLPASTTRADAIAALHGGRIDDGLVDRVDRVLADGEASQFSGGGAAVSTNLADNARACIVALDRGKPHDQGGAGE